MIMRRIVICGLSGSKIFFFPQISHKRHDFRGEKVTEHKMRVFIFSTTFVRNISYLRRQRHKIINVYWCLCKVPVILVRFWWNLHFLDSSSKNTQISHFMKIRPVGAELFHANWRTDRQFCNFAIRNFAKTPENCLEIPIFIDTDLEKICSIWKP